MIWQNAMLQPQQHAAHTLSFEAMGQNRAAPDVALTTFDIILTLRERPQGVTGTCLYKTDLFDASTISRMLDDFQPYSHASAPSPSNRSRPFAPYP